jgi:hypothetical protein
VALQNDIFLALGVLSPSYCGQPNQIEKGGLKVGFQGVPDQGAVFYLLSFVLIDFRRICTHYHLQLIQSCISPCDCILAVEEYDGIL